MEQLRFVARAAGADSSLLVEEAAQALSMFGRDPQALLVACKQLLTRQPTVGGLWWLCSRMLLASDARAEARAVVADLRSDPTARTLAVAVTGHPASGGASAADDDSDHGDWLNVNDRSDGPVVVTNGWPDVVVTALASSAASALVVEVDGVGPGVVRRLERADVEAETVAAERLAGAAEAADLAVVEAAAVGASTALVDVGGSALAAVASAVGTPVWLVAPPWRILPDALWADVIRGRDRWRGPAWLAPSELVAVERVDVVISGDVVQPTGPMETGLVSAWEPAPELIGVVSPRSD